MRKLQISTTLLVCALSLTVISGCKKELNGDVIIKNVSIVDVTNGEITENMDVIIFGDSIASIQEHQNSSYNTSELVDGTDKYLIPGLWDMHTHTWWGYEDFFPLLVANGVTGVREMFGDLRAIEKIRTEVKNGDVTGPMIYSGGPIVDGKPAMWPGSDEADSPEKGREIVRQQKQAGADFIKVYSFLEKDVYMAIADECKKQGLKFSGHIPIKVTLEEAMDAGHHSIEHFYGILEFMSSRKQHFYDHLKGVINDPELNSYPDQQGFLAKTFDAKKLDSVVGILKGKDVWISPTSTVNRSFANINNPEFRDDARLKYMPDYAISNWDPKDDFRLKHATPEDFENERQWYKKTLSVFKPMLDGGVRFLAGTDYPNPYTFPGFGIHDELQIFVEEAGFSPLEALQTATINPAIYMQKESELGTVETGKLANLVVLDKNPLEDINNTRSVHAVLLYGQYLAGTDLKEDLEKIAAHNSLPKIKDVLFEVVEKDGIEQAVARYHNLKESQPAAYNFKVGQLNSLGYQLLGMDKKEEAIAIFKLNTEVFPEDGNAYDSLGDAYAANNDTENAINAYQQAVALGYTRSQGKMEAMEKK
ncbi:MAG: amidohydrolase family protein [Flavobacteriaceae bacterium]